MSCREWKEIELGEVCEFQEGYVNPSQKVPEYFGNEIKWVRANDLNNGYVYDTSRKLSKKGFDSAGKSALLFEPDSIVISKSGTIGRLGIIKDYMCGNRATINVKTTKELAFFKYIFYYLLSNQAKIADMGVGSVQKNLYTSILELMPLSLPNLQEQKAIAATLSCLDDMIELNDRTNRVLEEMAQVIFKYWFVDFEFPNKDGQPYKSSGGAMADSELGEIPEGWRVGRFNELVDKTMSGDWGKANPQGKFTQKVVCIRGADIPEIAKGNKGNAPYRYINTKNLANKVLGPYEMIVEISGGSPTQSTGRCALISEELINSYEVPIVCTNFCRAIKFTKPEYSYFVYENWKYKYNNGIFFQYENGTTGIKNLDFLGVLTREPIIIPADRLLTDYSKILVTFTKTICEKAAENNVLSNIRDTLLPKLMSGEIRVPVEGVV